MVATVDAYFNLHHKVWSLKDRRTGRIGAHARAVIFAKGARFIVQAAGRAQVLRTGQKTVHAFVRGDATILDPRDPLPCLDGLTRVTYNPYTAEHFVRCDTQNRIDTAQHVVMLACEGRPPEVWAAL